MAQALIHIDEHEDPILPIVKGKYGFKNRDVKFVRKGQKGDWRSHFTKEDEETFLKVHGRTMRKLGYIE